eukprot:m.24186 g.24186  ORF g.24186 m.24186 type:complete len:530 (-) comp4136_c0_seq1:325-1914(-)
MFTNKKTLLAMSVASVFALSGCSSDDDKNEVVPDPIDPPVEVVVPPEAPAALGSVVNGNVIDAATTDVVASTVMFYENGVASTSLVDVDGNAVTSLTLEDGNFSVQLADDSDAESVTAIVMADGYIRKTFSIDLTQLSEGDLDVALPLVSADTEGYASAESDPQTVSGGSSAEAITSGVANGKATAAVTVPGGTQLQDANGDLITGDSVTLTVAAADTSTTAGSAVTPEGLNAGADTTVKTPVGVASVEMVDSNGTKVKSFSQPITVSMAIPADKGVSTGDMLTLVSQNEDTGVWSTETQQVEVKDLVADGSFYNASFMTDHLTFFAATTESAVCNSPIQMTFLNPVPKGSTIRLTSNDINATFVTKSEDIVTVGAGQVKKLGVSADAEAFVTIYDSEGEVAFSSENELAICGEVNIDNPASEKTYVDQDFTITATCSNDDTVSIPASGVLVQYRLEEGNKAKRKAAETETAGVYSLTDLVEGQNYTVTAKFRSTLSSVENQTYTLTAGEEASETVLVECDVTTGVTGS